MSIPTLISSLSAADESDRLFAADDLGASNSAEAIAPLLNRLEIETSPAVCEMIILALQRIESDAVLRQAVRLLASSKPFVRNEIAALFQTRRESAIPYLREAQRSPDPDVRKLALDAGWQIDSPKAGEVIGAALGDHEINNKIAAVEYVGLRGFSEFKGNVEELARGVGCLMLTLSCIETLSMIGDSASLEFLLDEFGDQVSLQAALAKAVGALGSARHISFLEKLALQSADPTPIIDALTSLRRRGKLTSLSPFWMDRLVAWLRSGSPLLSETAIIGFLGHFPDQPEAVALAADLQTAIQ